MKVLVVSANSCRDSWGEYTPYPLGAAYVAGAARKAGHSVRGLDLMFSEAPVEDTRRVLEDFRPDVAGIAIRNIDNQLMYDNVFFLPGLLPLIEMVKNESEATIVLGGPGFSIFPLECLEFFDVGLGIVGEAEFSFPALLSALESGRDPRGIPGVAVRKESQGSVNHRLRLPDLGPGTLPTPARELFDMSPYSGRLTFNVNAQFGRGCHMGCVYCSSPLIEGREPRRRNPRDVADELELLAGDYGQSSVSFVDSLFNYPSDIASEFCRELSSMDLPLKWVADINPRYNDPALYELMAGAGCVGVSIGAESGCDTMLANLGKGFSKAEVIRTFEDVKRSGLNAIGFTLLGGPSETRDTVEESIELMDSLDPMSVTVTTGIRVFPGCMMESLAIKEGLVNPGRNLLRPVFYVAPAVEPWLRGYVEEVCAARQNWSC